MCADSMRVRPVRRFPVWAADCLAAFGLMVLGAGVLPGCGPSTPKADMVTIPAGTYIVGRDNVENDVAEGPAHEVTLAAFEIDTHEVTNRQFHSFVASETCPGPTIPGNPDPCVYDGAVQSNTHPDYWTKTSDYGTYPVINVRWDQAEAYCRWLDKRLPTEAEWEVAARGTDQRIHPWGDDTPSCDLANYEGCTPDAIKVGSLEDGASPWGAEDMAGNVAEWTADWYNATYYSWGPTDNPTGPTNGQVRVVRGGSWYCPEEKLTTTYRDQADPLLQYNGIGFRCARSL